MDDKKKKKKGGLISKILEYHLEAKQKQAEELRKQRVKRDAARAEGKNYRRKK